MLYPVKNGQTSVVFRVKLRNSSVSTGAGLTGLTSTSSGLIISTIADNEATATAYTVAASTIETIATLGTFATPTATKCRFKQVDPTGHPGLYEVQLANARFAVASAKSLTVSFSGASNLAECDVVIPLWTVDPYTAILDQVSIESGSPTINARQALALILASEAGVIAGMDTGSPVMKGAGTSTTRISATASGGNRPSVTLTPPA